MRDLTSAFSDALTHSTIFPIFLAELETETGSEIFMVRVWTGIGDLIFNGNIFQGVGNQLSIGPVQETGDGIRANAHVFQLSGILSQHLSMALGTQYQGRPVKLWLGALSPSGIITDPALIFSGRADVMVIDEGPDTSVISVTAESRLADLDRPRIRRYTDADQQAEFPGDLGLEFVAAIQNEDLMWSE